MCFLDYFNCNRKRKNYTRDDGINWEEVDFMIKLQKEQELTNRKAPKFEDNQKLAFLKKPLMKSQPINIKKFVAQ